MPEEESVSAWLFNSARMDGRLRVLSWQAVDGKGYFTADVKLRLPSGDRLEPDLVLLQDKRVLWLIEVKGTHEDALQDEDKLTELIDLVSLPALVTQIATRAGTKLDVQAVRIAVGFGDDWDAAKTECLPGIAHLSQARHEKPVAEKGLAALLDELAATE